MQNVTRVTVPLTEMELGALLALAERETRHPREMMRHLLRQEANKYGLLTIEVETAHKTDGAQAAMPDGKGEHYG